jgi:hypothetical protein
MTQNKRAAITFQIDIDNESGGGLSHIYTEESGGGLSHIYIEEND